MKPLTKIGLATGKMTDDEVIYLDKAITSTVRPLLVGRRLFSAKSIGNAGYRSVKYYTETDMGQALIDMEGQEEAQDLVSLNEKTVNIPIIHKEFVLYWRDLLVNRAGGLPLDSQHASNAARQVAEEEDKLLLTGEYTGWNALGIQGLATATNRQTQATSGAWTQANIANAFTDINACISKLEAQGHQGPYKLILRTAQRAKLRYFSLAAGADTWAFDRIAELLGGPAEDTILASDSLYSSAGATTTGLVVEALPDNFDMVIGADMQTQLNPLINGNYWGRIWEALTPRIKRPLSICELTGLS
jgi:uncharacterized linocin/CFP29 family protein